MHKIALKIEEKNIQGCIDKSDKETQTYWLIYGLAII